MHIDCTFSISQAYVNNRKKLEMAYITRTLWWPHIKALQHKGILDVLLLIMIVMVTLRLIIMHKVGVVELLPETPHIIKVSTLVNILIIITLIFTY